MKKIYVILDPKSRGSALPIKDFFYKILSDSFINLGRDFEIIRKIENNIDVFDCIFIFIMSPKRLSSVLNKINKNNNIFVFWNLEPITNKNINRYFNYFNIVKNICSDNKIDYVWCFNDYQKDILNTNKFVYVPIGVEHCISNNNYIKNKNIVFIGAKSLLRNNLFSSISFKIENPEYTSFEDMIKNISSFKIGIDNIAENGEQYIRWHRLILYSANKVVCLIDNNKLEKHGFVDKKHYFYYKNSTDLCNILSYLSKNNNVVSCVAENMYNKIFQEYKMSNILSIVFEKYNL